MGRGNFEGKSGPIVKYIDILRSSVQKGLNRSRYRLSLGSDVPKESCVRWGPKVLRDVAMATAFWLLMGYNFGCMIASDMLLDSWGEFSNFLAFYIRGAQWHHLANTTKQSVCCGDAALCQITLTTC